MFNKKQWTKIEPQIHALPGGEELCENIRKGQGHKPWGEIGEAMYSHKGFPREEFSLLAHIGDIDIRWPLTFAAWYWLSSGPSIDQECADFYTSSGAWDYVIAILPEYSCIDGLSEWAKRFIEYRKPFQTLYPLEDRSEIPSLEEMKNKLDQLRVLDSRLQVFGAAIHQYKSYPLSEDKIEIFEDEIGVPLPEEYRLFLIEIGYGAGPYYGLFSPEDSLSWLLEDEGEQETWPPKPAQPFPVTPDQAYDCWRDMSEGHYASVTVYWPANGCIPICTEGCTYFTYLITSGDLIGSLWSRNTETDPYSPCFPYNNNWNLAPQPPGITNLHKLSEEPLWHQALSQRPTFLEWYNAWLDQCIVDCDFLNRNELSSSIDNRNRKSRVRRFMDKLRLRRGNR